MSTVLAACDGGVSAPATPPPAGQAAAAPTSGAPVGSAARSAPKSPGGKWLVNFGDVFAVWIDLDGDGTREIAVGAPGAVVSGVLGAGSVFVFSGKSGALLRRFDGARERQFLGSALCAGVDVDQDGIDDLLVSSGEPSIVHVVSGKAGAPMAPLRVGEPAEAVVPVSLAPLRDPAGRSFGVAIGVTGAAVPAGCVVLHRMGAEGPSRRLPGSKPESEFGACVASSSAGAEFKSGTRIAVGAPWAGSIDGIPCGEVRVFADDGSTASGVRTGESQREGLGKRIVPLGDVSGDGIGDFAVAGSAWGPMPDRHQAGRVLVLSGADASILRQIEGAGTNERVGMDISATDDLDGDGKFDVVCGAQGWEGSRGIVRVHSSATGKELARYEGSEDGWSFGHRVVGDSDIDGNGVRDLLVLSLSKGSDSVRRVDVYLNRSTTRALRLVEPPPEVPGAVVLEVK